MGKGEIRIIHVPRWVTVALWVLLSAAMAGVIYALSGRAYAQERASVAAMIADILFFLPWGAVAFLALDRAGSSRARTYLLTLLVGVAFALALIAWQQTLPTQVTGWIDAIWNSAGCLAGAVAGHARKRMRIRFA